MAKDQAERFMDKCQLQADASGVKVHAYQTGPHAFKMILDGEDRPAGVHVGTREPSYRTPLHMIHNVEELIVNVGSGVTGLTSAYRSETANGRRNPIDRNRDSWGTLYANACRLRGELSQFIKAMDKEFSAADTDVYTSEHDSNGNA